MFRGQCDHPHAVNGCCPRRGDAADARLYAGAEQLDSQPSHHCSRIWWPAADDPGRDDEVLLDDSAAQRMRRHRRVTDLLQFWPQLWHVWHLYVGCPADAAMRAIADFVP